MLISTQNRDKAKINEAIKLLFSFISIPETQKVDFDSSL